MSPARRLSRAVAVLSLVTGALAGPALLDPGSTGASARGRAADTTDSTPLSVQMTGMTPAVVPKKGQLVISGVVRNDSDETWTDINVAPFMSSEPITTRDQLLEAAATDPADAVGSRLSDAGTYVNVGDLLPKESTTFTLRVPRSSMPIGEDPGVYWVGVHALGSNQDGRDLVADGRARSFIPLVGEAQRRRSVDVSLLLPFRDRARRADDGSLNGPARWAALTGASGRLHRLADFAASAGSAGVTWEVDPAVLDALEDYANGNPPLSLGPARRVAQPAKSASPSPSATPSDAASADPSESVSPGDHSASERPSDAERQEAGSVLSTFLGAVRGDGLLTMPYGDPDVAALVRNHPSLLTRAQSLAARRMQAHGLTGTSAVAPPEARFDPDLLGGIGADTAVVVGDSDRLAAPPYSRLPSGQPLVLTDERASDGGPAPAGDTSPLALRQRILAEAVLDLDDPTAAQRPIVVRFPMRWNPGASWREADFFRGLDRPWLRLVPASLGGTTTYQGTLPYGRAQRAQEIGSDNVATTRALVHTGDVLADLLANTNDVHDRLTGAAMQASAYSARGARRSAADGVAALDTTVRDRMQRVQVTGTDFVTLSGGSGTLTVTLVNGLRQPINVGLRTRTDSPSVRVESADPIALGPNQRTTLRLSVRSSTGLHEVSMYPVTSDAQVVGTPFTFNVRTSQVGQVIWYVLAGGGALLVVMILRRIVLRIRNRRWRLEDPA